MSDNERRETDEQQREIEERRAATTLINMLPTDPESAQRVLDYAKELVEGFLKPRDHEPRGRVFSIRAVKTDEKGG